MTLTHLGGLAALALLSLLAWAWLALFHGRFWRGDQRLPVEVRNREGWPGVAVVVPARNEAGTIGAAVRSLLDQDYPGALVIVVVDDGSDDGTAAAADAAGAGDTRLRIVEGTALPAGWTGKLWALAQGVDHAAAVLPEAHWLLLTDADIAHDARNLRRLMAKAEDESRDLVSLMVRLVSASGWERLLIPAFVFFFQKLYPFPRVNDPASRTAAAAGGCMLVRRAALARIGGIEAIRGEVIDDCALARAIKRGGGSVWLGLTERTRSLRGYGSLAGIWNMVARSAYVQLRHSVMLLIGTLAGMALLYLVPPLTLAAGLAARDAVVAGTGGAAWVLMAALYRPTLALYGEPPWRGLLLPVAAALYGAMTAGSAWRSWRGRGAGWKGRHYAPPSSHWRVTRQGASGMLGRMQKSEATEYVTRVVKQSGTSFYWAMRLLPPEKREAMYAVYAFCREVDDIADNLAPEADKRRRLAAWRDEIARIYGGRPETAVGLALRDVVEDFELKREGFLSVIEGMEIDSAAKLRIRDMAELETYCDHVACAVGRLSNRVFGVDDAKGEPVAVSLGQALQLTNILRDLEEDAALDRLYLPTDRLAAHGITDDDPAAVLAHPNLSAVCNEIAEIARRRYMQAEAALDACDQQTMRPAIMMMHVYRGIFEALRRRGWTRLSQPVSLPPWQKLWILLRHGVV